MPSFLLSPIIEPQFAPSAQTVLFTAPVGVAARIDSLSVTNTGTAVATISINIVPNGGAAGASNLITDAQAVQPKQTWPSPNEIGKVLASGDAISVLASAPSQLVIAAGGLLQA